MSKESTLIEYCNQNRIPIKSEKTINSSHKIKIEYFFGIKYSIMKNKKYNEIPNLLPLAKKSQLEKDIDNEVREIFGLGLESFE